MIKRHQTQMMALEKHAPTGMNVINHNHQRTDAHDVGPSREKHLFFSRKFRTRALRGVTACEETAGYMHRRRREESLTLVISTRAHT